MSPSELACKQVDKFLFRPCTIKLAAVLSLSAWGCPSPNTISDTVLQGKCPALLMWLHHNTGHHPGATQSNELLVSSLLDLQLRDEQGETCHSFAVHLPGLPLNQGYLWLATSVQCSTATYSYTNSEDIKEPTDLARSCSARPGVLC